MKALVVRLDDDLHEKLRVAAFQRRDSMSELVREGIREVVKDEVPA